MTETVLYLSPHLDDVVLSCTGRVLRDRALGRRVVVATLFTEGEPTLYAARRAEDAEALALLDAEPLWLGLPDAPFRRDTYRSFRDIVLDYHPEDRPYVKHVAQRLDEVIDQVSPKEIIAPLGIGGHVDHWLTHMAMRELNVGMYRQYEDRPYCFVKHALRLQLLQSGTAPPEESNVDVEAAAVELQKDLRSWHWLDTYLPAGPERDECSRRLAERLRTPPHGRLAAARYVETLEFGEPTLEVVVAANMAYRTQFPDLFSGPDDLRRASREYAQRIGSTAPHAERYWFC